MCYSKSHKILNIISTPIGNLFDLSFRALLLLKKTIIFCENKNVTKKLLNNFNIKNKIFQLRDFDKIKKNKPLSIVSDSGTPIISDPGFNIIKWAIKNKYKISTIPGASSLIGVLVLSGLPVNQFIFLGFLNKSTQKARNQLIKYICMNKSIIIFENANRLFNTLKNIKSITGNICKITICSELTKINEKIIRGNINNLLQNIEFNNIKGELTLIIFPFKKINNKFIFKNLLTNRINYFLNVKI